ncbi:MAG: Na+/H+ antiporter NhaC family protein [Rikenellaceae bacterium]|nr:Na+/H+ antiporter NhaC family protein [Rikenellaceae bacterium]
MKRGLLALSPIVVLLVAYLAMSLASGDFYRISISVAFVVAAVYAVVVMRNISRSLQERVSVFSEGASDKNIMYMIWIFVLAGIFAATAKAMGAVDATVHFTLRFVPTEFLPAGIFVAACFVSLSIGTSVGTIVALTPVVTGLAAQLGADTAQMVAIVVGGAFFGDNLSFISDTTIAATMTQGCNMRDKFRTNLLIVLPAALLSLGLYLFLGLSGAGDVDVATTAEWYKAIPYILVLVCAIAGMNVLIVLVVGIVATAIIGLASGSLSGVLFFEAADDGIISMCELIVITLMAGGLMNMVKQSGGFQYITALITRRISGKRGAEAAIAGLTILADMCTANNTIAIITMGPIARDLSLRYGVSPRKSASIMDTASCFAQGIIPYGAQLLMASGLAGVSPIEIIPHLYYPMAIGVMVVLSIVFQFPRIRD